MFIVITGLDGSGTSTIGEGIHKMDNDSYLFKTPSVEYSARSIIDEKVRQESKVGHMLYYLSSTVYMSDYIRNHCDYKSKNVYLVRYLIDTVVSNRVAGIPIEMNYNVYGNELLVPDLTLFVAVNEELRAKRISSRGKNELDRVLDEENKRKAFLEEFRAHLPDSTLYVNNDSLDVTQTIKETYQKIKRIQKK